MEQKTRKITSDILFPAIESLLREQYQVSFTVTGTSMWPLMRHGRDQVVVEACEPESLKLGDIILFRTECGNYILHRVTGLKPGLFETTGDGNCFRDGWFPKSCVCARVTCVIRGNRRILCGKLRWKAVFWVWMHLFWVRKKLLAWLKRAATWKNRMKRVAKRMSLGGKKHERIE